MSEDLRCNICELSFPDDKLFVEHFGMELLMSDTRIGEAVLRQEARCCKTEFHDSDADNDFLKFEESDKAILCPRCSLEFTASDFGVFKCDTCDIFVSRVAPVRIKKRKKSVKIPDIGDMKFVKQDAEFDCQFCVKKFLNKKSRLIHENKFCQISATKNFNNSQLKCPICLESSFENGMRSFEEHVKTHLHIQSTYQCAFCPYSWPFVSKLLTHYSSLHLETRNKSQCLLCGHFFKVAQNLTYHYCTAHFNEKPYVCGLCGSAHGSPPLLSVHRKLAHLGTTIKCDLCKNKFASLANLDKHKLDMH